MKYTYSIYLALVFIGLSLSAKCQILDGLLEPDGYYNYVPNPGFEKTVREYCRWNQNGRKYMEDIHDWDSPTETTPDIFSLRLKPTCWANPTHHSDGKQSPKSGDNMAGIKTYGKGGTETFWHEYLIVELDSTLIPGERYYAEFYTSRAVKSDKATNNIGMYFSDTAVVTRDRMPLFFTPEVNTDEIIKSRWNIWKKVSGVFTVDTEKRYVLIGNFYNDDVTSTNHFPEGEGGGYYYIDDVTVRRAKPEEGLTPKPKESIAPRPKRILEKTEIITTKQITLDSIDYKVGNTVTLDNIFFEFDKSTILPESKPELKKLMDILSDYPYLTIQISGHTDNVGSDSYNEKLSQARAKSVVDYLKDEKVDSSRLSYKGYGSTMPVALNATDEGRAKNRRVEFTVIKN